MRIGITYDLKSEFRTTGTGTPFGAPDDWQEEFDSPVTIDGIAQVLRNLGHEVVLLGDGRELIEQLLDRPPEFVFNIAEGEGIARSREARVPALLEMLGIPHTGSDPLTLAAGLDKDVSKKLVQGCSPYLKIPFGVRVEPSDSEECKTEIHECGSRTLNGVTFPAILKPAWEGSSKGIRGRCVVENPVELREELERMHRDYQQPIMIEQYIEGDELTVGVLGNGASAEVLGIMRVVPNTPTERFVYSLEVKRDYLDLVTYECPPPYPADLLTKIEQAALAAFHALGCRDVARIDFRLSGNEIYFIEANPLPGVNPQSSDLCIMARLVGWTYPRLIERILESALERQRLAAPLVS